METVTILTLNYQWLVYNTVCDTTDDAQTKVLSSDKRDCGKEDKKKSKQYWIKIHKWMFKANRHNEKRWEDGGGRTSVSIWVPRTRDYHLK